MSNFHGRLTSVACLTVGAFLSVSNPLAAEEQAAAPIAIQTSAAVSSDAAGTSAPSQGTPARPAALMPLYISFGVLQALDMRSTQVALSSGGREGNPIVGGVVGSPLAMGAMKVGAAAGIILLTEKVRKRNPVAAVVTMVALNSVYAMVVSHNYSIAK